MWLDDFVQWMQKKFDEVKRLSENREQLEKDDMPTF